MKMYEYDIECLKGFFCICLRDLETNRWVVFQLSAYKNNLDAMVKFLSTSEIDYLIGYNSLSYDMQIIEYILRYNQKWFDLSNKEILAKIYKFSQNTINRSNHEMKPIYWEK